MARKEKIYHYIYKTTNLLNGKYYYGMHSTDNLEDGYLGSGKRLRYSVNKHGAENHKVEILEFLSDRVELAKREKEIVTLNEIANENCMNLMVGGNGGFFSKDAARLGWEKMNNVLSLRYGTNFRTIIMKKYYDISDNKLSHGKKITEGQKKRNCKFGESFKGKKHKQETINLMKQSRLLIDSSGENNSQFGTSWITNGIENKKIGNLDIVPENWKYGRISNIKY